MIWIIAGVILILAAMAFIGLVAMAMAGITHFDEWKED